MDITKASTSEEIQTAADNLISPVGVKSSHAGVKSAFVGVESAHGSTQIKGQALSKSENPLGKNVKFVSPIKIYYLPKACVAFTRTVPINHLKDDWFYIQVSGI